MFFPFPGGHCFFTSSSFPRMIYNKNMFFLHLTKFEKKHTSYKNTCEKIWAISHGYATNPYLIPGGYVRVGTLTSHASSQSSPSYYPGNVRIHLTIAMSHLPRTSSGSWWKLSSHDVLWQGATRVPSRQSGGWLGSWWPVVLSSWRNWWKIDRNSGVNYLSNWKAGFQWI